MRLSSSQYGYPLSLDQLPPTLSNLIFDPTLGTSLAIGEVCPIRVLLAGEDCGEHPSPSLLAATPLHLYPFSSPGSIPLAIPNPPTAFSCDHLVELLGFGSPFEEVAPINVPAEMLHPWTITSTVCRAKPRKLALEF